MNANTTRKLLPELIIIAAVFYGLWNLLIVPMRESLHQAQVARSSAIEHTRISADPALSAPRLRDVMGSIDGMMTDIEQRSEVARDQTALQAQIMEIGEQSGILIDRVNPAKTRPLDTGDRADSVVSFELDCSGQFSDLIAFFESMEENVGLTEIENFSIRPDTSSAGGGAAAVKARLRTLHFAFDTSPAPVLADAMAPEGGDR